MEIMAQNKAKTTSRKIVILRNIIAIFCFCILFVFPSFADVTYTWLTGRRSSWTSTSSLPLTIFESSDSNYNPNDEFIFAVRFSGLSSGDIVTMNINNHINQSAHGYVISGAHNSPNYSLSNSMPTSLIVESDDRVTCAYAFTMPNVTSYTITDPSELFSVSINDQYFIGSAPLDPVSTSYKTVTLPVGWTLCLDTQGIFGSFILSGNLSDTTIFGGGITTFKDTFTPKSFGYKKSNSILSEISVDDISILPWSVIKRTVLGRVTQCSYSQSITIDENRYIYVAFPQYTTLAYEDYETYWGSIPVRIPINIPCSLYALTADGINGPNDIDEDPYATVDQDGNFIDSDGNIVIPSQGGGNSMPSDTSITSLLSNLISKIQQVFETPVNAIQTIITSGSSYAASIGTIFTWLPSDVSNYLIAVLIVMISFGVIKAFL